MNVWKATWESSSLFHCVIIENIVKTSDMNLSTYFFILTKKNSTYQMEKPLRMFGTITILQPTKRWK